MNLEVMMAYKGLMAWHLNEMLYFLLEVNEYSSLLCYYTACSVNSLLMFPDNLSVPSSRVKNLLDMLPLKVGK